MRALSLFTAILLSCACAFAGQDAPKPEQGGSATAPPPATATPSPAATPELHAVAAHEQGQTQGCGACHVSETPTKESAQLKGCQRSKTETNGHSTKEAADVLFMGELSQIYVPVAFPHKLHASMTEMSGGCETCHHRNPPGPIQPCKSCHGGPSNPSDLEQPGLKGAYHRQCLGCHREWTHETDCAICHVKKVPGKVDVPADPTDIMGRLHPNIEVPSEKVYATKSLEETPVVTFRHKEHAESFGLKCVECHRQENCSSCHDPKQSHEPRVRKDPHEDCTRCHEKELSDNCGYCHTKEKTTGFDHAAVTGYTISPFHAGLSCKQCHSGAGRFQKASKDCATCHPKDWKPKTADFDHAKTGQPLDELHKGLECKDCHAEGMGKPATCTPCHDDNRKFLKPEAKEAVKDAPKEATPEPAAKPVRKSKSQIEDEAEAAAAAKQAEDH